MLKRQINNKLIPALLTVILVLISGSCRKSSLKREMAGVSIDFQIERFEQELFGLSSDSLEWAVPGLWEKYSDFLDIYSYYVIRIGSPASKDYAEGLRYFLLDEMNRSVYDSVQMMYADISEVENEFREAFRHYRYYFPESQIPKVISYTGGFNHPVFTVENYLGIGLDQFLGDKFQYYTYLGIPNYVQRTMDAQHLVPAALYYWANERFPFNDSTDHLLAQLIHEGKMAWFIHKLQPDKPLENIFGFTSDQVNWVKKNEEEMWVYLVENKLIFSNDAMEIRKLLGPAPYTSFFSTESPGRAIVYNGYKMVEAYAKRNPELSLAQIMEKVDYEDILRKSRYNP